MKRQLLWVGVSGLILVTLVLGLAGGIVLDRYLMITAAPPSEIPTDAVSEFQLMAEAWNIIQQVYVDRAVLQPRNLAYGAISGMTDALGDTGHSRFLTPEMVQVQKAATRGEFEGIGVEVQLKDAHLTIVAPIDGSPAFQAGLRPGDVILEVDGKDITGLPLDQVVGLILGPAGTSVTLTILSPDSGQTQEVTLQRAHITIHNVTWAQLPDTQIALIRISAFSQGVAKDLENALTDILQENPAGLILDLRSNPGGLLEEAVGTASQFLQGGNVLLEKNAQGEVTPIEVTPGKLALDIPLVALIDYGTASASEIVAGALQDAERAVLVGETTFGTGTVLNTFSLPDGSALLLATEEWLTPNGRVIWHTGLKPDVVVNLAPDATPLIPATIQDLTPAQLRTSGDDQLLRAIDLLTERGKDQSEHAGQGDSGMKNHSPSQSTTTILESNLCQHPSGRAGNLCLNKKIAI
jgi:carboxyl-terminal processing protease